MKKILLMLLSIAIYASTTSYTIAKSSATPVTAGIRLYKAGNYVQAYNTFHDIVAKDPSNAVAYYYLAMSAAQVGKKNEAISNYERVLTLSPGGKLGYYAKKGKTCIENPNKCNSDESTSMDKFVQSNYGSGFSEEFRSKYEDLKIQNMMREMNRNDDVDTTKFKEYSDFSSQAPTNDEIVNALRTLQRAGLGNMINGNNPELTFLTGQNYNNNYEMINMLLGNGSQNSLSPQVIQSLLTNQMSVGF